MQCTFMSLDTTLQSFYRVPLYQRDYVWQEENVRDLLDDIKTNTAPDAPLLKDHDDTYFIGSIVVFKNQPAVGNEFILIDGQQRLTTLFLVLCAIKSRFIKLGAHRRAEPLQTLLRTTQIAQNGELLTSFRLELNYEKTQDLLKQAYQDRLTDSSASGSSRTQRNIVNAHKCITVYLEEECSEEEQLQKFVGKLLNRVGLVRIEADNLEKAMIVFETLNDRGVGLDSFDLLKNLLYRHVLSDAQMEDLTETWHQIKENLDRKHIKPMRFLRYFCASIDDELGGRPPFERNTFAWFRDENNRTKFKIDARPIQFAREIAAASNRYKNMLIDGVNHRGEKSPALHSLNELAGSSVRQHMALLLVAAQTNCSSAHFEKIVEVMESALFYSFSTKLRSQELEGRMANWTMALKRIAPFTDENVTEFASSVWKDSSVEYERFYNEFDNFGQRVVSQSYRQRYILAKYLQYSERANKMTDVKFLSDITNDGTLEIEHVFPQTPSEGALSEFGDANDEERTWATGLLANLLLMEGSLHKAVSNKAYSLQTDVEKDKTNPIKKKIYPNSKFWMVKKFSTDDLHAPIKLKEALAAWPTHATWNMSELKKRQDSYKEFAKEIWNFGL